VPLSTFSTPWPIAAQAGGDEEEQDLAERLVGDRTQRFLLVGGRAAFADRDLQRQDRDDQVDQAAG
jgi:hypothetical protein